MNFVDESLIFKMIENLTIYLFITNVKHILPYVVKSFQKKVNFVNDAIQDNLCFTKVEIKKKIKGC